MSELDQIRENINDIDEQMARLFQRRMKMSAQAAAYKRERGLPVRDEERERALLSRNCERLTDAETAEYYVQFLRKVLELSCAYQSRLLGEQQTQER